MKKIKNIIKTQYSFIVFSIFVDIIGLLILFLILKFIQFNNWLGYE